MIDSHTHLDLCDPPNAELVARAVDAGVDRILNVGIDVAGSRAALRAADAFPQVFAAVGLHPNSAEGFADDDLEELRALATHPRCVAIGETGLDFYRDRAPAADQRRAFVAQIELAAELDKPLVIHTRAADEETLEILRAHASGVRVVMHCFSMAERLDECVAAGWFVSFAGNVTYPRNVELADAAARVPVERLLAETDAPFLAPQSRRGRPNEPAGVAEVTRFIAERRGCDAGELGESIAANGRALFGWS